MHHNHHPRPGTQRGFSLIEMTVAITVGLLLIAGLAITTAGYVVGTVSARPISAVATEPAGSIET